MLIPPTPDECPCGRGGEHLPEDSTLYNHQYVTHRVALASNGWAVCADLPRMQSQAEKAAAKVAHDRARRRWAQADREWRRLLTSPSEAFHDLVVMHRPALSEQDFLGCTFCSDEFGHDPAEWPCDHYSLLAQLANQP
jgi:hypothetical protein